MDTTNVAPEVATISDECLVDMVQRDHVTLVSLFGRLDETPTADLTQYFCELRTELVRHEVAEELVVFPALLRKQGAAAALAEACMAEQYEVERQLASLDGGAPEAPPFRARLEELRRVLQLHVRREEGDVLPLLEWTYPPDALAELGRRYRRALEAAPTHPHPHPPGPDVRSTTLALVPVAPLFDWVRAAMRHGDQPPGPVLFTH